MLPAKAEGHTRRARCQSWFYCILSFNPFILFTNSFSFVQNIDKPEAKAQSKAQSPKSPKKGKEEFGLWASH